MKIAVLGARGFIGTELCKALEDFELVAIARSQKANSFCKINPLNDTVIEDDLSLGSLLKGVDIVFHLAGKSSMDRSGGKPFGNLEHSMLSDYFRDNISLTEMVCRECVRNNVKKLIFTSSRLVYAPSELGRTENNLLEPIFAYGLSKKIAEELIIRYSKECDLKYSILRLSQVIGNSGQGQGIIKTFIDKCSVGQKIKIFGTGSARRNLIYIDDVISAFKKAINIDSESVTLNIVNDRSYTIKEIAEAVVSNLGVSRELIEYDSSNKEDLTQYNLSNSLAKEFLGWEPKVDLNQMVFKLKGA